MAIHLRKEDGRRVPWKNGQGTTLELATDATMRGGPWTWRLSIADVPTSGPFSRFEGHDRLIACLDGDGMTLVVDGRSLDVPHVGEALAFSGDLETTGRLRGGACRDVNLIVRRDRWRARLWLLRGDVECRLSSVATALVHVVDGEVSVIEGESVGHDLTAGESLVVRGASTATTGSGVVVLAAIERASA